MCLNETYSRVRIGKNLSEKFTVQNGLKQGDCFSTLFGDMQSGGTDTEWDTSASGLC
jgi:hypothetical protein